MPTPTTTAAVVDTPETTFWRGVITTGAVVFSLRTAYDIWSVRTDYERVVVRDGLPPLYALVIFGAALLPIFSAYIAAATLWLRRSWAPRAIVNYGVAVDVSRIAVRYYFTRGRNAQLFSGNEWAALISLVIITIVAAVIVHRSLAVAGASEPTANVPVPRWENWLTIAAAVPPTLFAANMLRTGGDASDGGSSLSQLAWISFPIILLLIKRFLDGLLSLRPTPRSKEQIASRDMLPPGTFVSPQTLAEFLTSRVVSRTLDGPDSILRTLRTRGLRPPKAPPEYDVELLLYTLFIYDTALAHHDEPLSDQVRINLRGTARAAANNLLAESQRSTYTLEAWDQLVGRRFKEYETHAPRPDSETGSSERPEDLSALCATVVRYASKSHVTNPRAAKVLMEFFTPELTGVRASLTQCVLVSKER
jgi:hypothetical protein